jgi:caffeoyl-CoA O-methyltransferase
MNRNLNLQKLEDYCHSRTSEPPALLKNLERATQHEMHAPQMLCGKLEGRFLKLLAQLVNAKKILEIGMFTGYSALSMAEALPVDGKLITLDIDPKAENFARRYFTQSPHGHKIEIKMGPALDTIQQLTDTFDLVFIDAEKKQYPDYFLNILPKVRAGGLLVVDNTLSEGRVLEPQDTERGRLMDEFNSMVARHTGVETVLLPVRDGITLIRKK